MPKDDTLAHVLSRLFGMLCVGAAALVLSAYRNARTRGRAREWSALATQLGCRFSADDPFGTAASSRHGLFAWGERKVVRNMLDGHYRGRALRCFDYSYTMGYGKDSRTYRLTVLMVMAPAPLEPVSIRPERSARRTAPSAPGVHVELESEEFNRAFRVECADHRFASDLLHPRMMEFLLRFPWMTVQISAESVVFFHWRKPLLRLPDQVRFLINLGCDFMDLLPEHLLRERAAVSAAKERQQPNSRRRRCGGECGLDPIRIGGVT